MDEGSLSDTQRTMVLPLLQETNIRGKPYVTVSSKGIVNGLSRYPNDGADFGPDTTLGATAPGQYGSPYTETTGIQEAYSYAISQLNKKIFIMNGNYTITTTVSISSDVSIEGEMIGKKDADANFYGGTAVGVIVTVLTSGIDAFLIQGTKTSGITVSMKNIIVDYTQVTTAGYGFHTQTVSGADSEVGSVYASEFDNLYVLSNDPNVQGFYFGDFLYSRFGRLYSLNGGGFYFGNSANSTSFNPGNSVIDLLYWQMNDTAGNISQIGIEFYGSVAINLMVVNYIQIINSANASTGATYETLIELNNCNSTIFNVVDLENLSLASSQDIMLFNAYGNRFNCISSGVNGRLYNTGTGGAGNVVTIIPNASNWTLHDLSGGNIYYLSSGNTTLSAFSSASKVVYFGNIPTPTISANPPVSGTAYQNTNPYDIRLKIPVTYSPTSTAAATLATGTSSTSTVTTSTKVSYPAGITTGIIDTYEMVVPAGQYFELVATNATIGTVEVQAA